MIKFNFLKSHNLLVMLAFFIALFTVQAAFAQTTTFANFSTTGGGRPYVFTNNSSSATFNTIPAGAPVRFFYDDTIISGLATELIGQQNATLTMTSTTNVAATGTTTFSQPIVTMTIAIIRNTAPVDPRVGLNSRRNLLTMTITTGNPTLSGTTGAGSASISAANVTYTSDFLNFGGTTARDMGLSFSGASPVWTFGTGNFLSTTATTGTGTFASNPIPIPYQPLAASVTISGKVMTSTGRGLSNATVVLTDADGTIHHARTSTFGYYSFSEVAAGQNVTLMVNSKRYSFPAQLMNVFGDITDFNFYANP